MGPTLSHETPSPRPLEGTLKKRSKETIFIFDWDDTLICTSFITLKTQSLSEEEKNTILNLGNLVSAFLSHCQEYGKIIILTNSSESWVKNTSVNILGISDLIDKNINIFSTRDKYSKKGIEQRKWKEMALDEIFNKYGDKLDNLICASDSEKDINIFKKFMQKNKGINISTIKFKRKPSPLIMVKEIKYLLECINSIIGTKKNYYLMKEEKERRTDDFNFHIGNFFDYIFLNQN